MKYKTTAKELKEYPYGLIKVPYCDAQHLLYFQGEATAYSCGVYGWNFDVYHVGDLRICTGYRGMPGRASELVRVYDKKAKRILNDRSRSYESRKRGVTRILRNYIRAEEAQERRINIERLYTCGIITREEYNRALAEYEKEA